MNAWSFYEGVNLVSGAKDGSGAEIFAINLKEDYVLGSLPEERYSMMAESYENEQKKYVVVKGSRVQPRAV